MIRAKASEILLRALIWASVVIAALILWRIQEAILLAFGAVIVATLLRMLSDLVSRLSGLHPSVALAIAVALVAAVFGGTFLILGANVSAQIVEVFNRAQAAEQQIRSELASSSIGGLIENLEREGSSTIGGVVRYVLATSLSVAEGAVVLAISAIYLAAQPELYRDGFVRLFAPYLRASAAESMNLIGRSLRLWLLGQLILMVMVGGLSLGATWIIGLPGPLALGLIAGVTEMVPYIGPIIGAIPALLVATTQGMVPALWTAGAYLLIHMLEGYVVGPAIQQRFVHIPPATMLLGIVAIELIFGPFGLLIAAPLTVTLFFAVKVLYIRNTLHEPSGIPGGDRC